jgi:hypothetical protein
MTPIEWAFGLLGSAITATLAGGVKTIMRHDGELKTIKANIEGLVKTVDKMDSRQEELIDFLLREKRNGQAKS